mmetsp:Transcript_4989/g.12513  ORF Transcript_4989/g.12513 Transcript_4989/m.12513 type:complete len:452 (-) Transcript_4989:80-1435(-)
MMTTAATLPVEKLSGASCAACGLAITTLSTQIAVPYSSFSRSRTGGTVTTVFPLYHVHCLQRALALGGEESIIPDENYPGSERPSCSSASSTAKWSRSKAEAATTSKKAVSSKRSAVIELDDHDDEQTVSATSVSVAVFARFQIERQKGVSDDANAVETAQNGLGLNSNLLGNATITERQQLLPAEKRRAEKTRREQKAKRKAADPLCETHSEMYFLVQRLSKIGDLLSASSQNPSKSLKLSCCSRPLDLKDATSLPCEGCGEWFHSYCVGLGNSIDLEPENASAEDVTALVRRSGGSSSTSSAGASSSSSSSSSSWQKSKIAHLKGNNDLQHALTAALHDPHASTTGAGSHINLRGAFFCEVCARARRRRRNVDELPPAFQKVSQIAAFTPTVALPEVGAAPAANAKPNYLARFAAKRRKVAAEQPESKNRFDLNPVYETDFLGGGKSCS